MEVQHKVVNCCTLHSLCRHPHVRIEAHKVYNEYIQDKNHVHMNSTKWLTLTEYVKYLGREGFCKVEETPKGWFMQVIHRDTEQVDIPVTVTRHAYACITLPTLRHNAESGWFTHVNSALHPWNLYSKITVLTAVHASTRAGEAECRSLQTETS